jgi:putative phosphoesterase
MKIAFFSDVHANLPALEAVLQGIDSQKPDAIYCLGDLVNQNVWNNEVVDLIREREIPTIQGNHDEGIGSGKSFFNFTYTFPEAKQWGKEAIAYTLKNITKGNQEYLAKLPKLKHLAFQLENGTKYRLVMAHGSPTSIDEHLFRSTKEERFNELLNICEADVMLTGNTHSPYHKVICVEKANKKIYRHVINPGSVGRPRDGNWHPIYVILTIDHHKDLLEHADALAVDFYRVEYDLGKVVRAIKNSELSVYYGSCLITG